MPTPCRRCQRIVNGNIAVVAVVTVPVGIRVTFALLVMTPIRSTRKVHFFVDIHVPIPLVTIEQASVRFAFGDSSALSPSLAVFLVLLATVAVVATKG
jgi:uncharacterized membrane protein